MKTLRRWIVRPKKRANLRVETSDLKMMRETLSIAQSRVHRSPHQRARLQKLIDEIERHRPTASNGKHGNLHTRACGCEDR